MNRLGSAANDYAGEQANGNVVEQSNTTASRRHSKLEQVSLAANRAMVSHISLPLSLSLSLAFQLAHEAPVQTGECAGRLRLIRGRRKLVRPDESLESHSQASQFSHLVLVRAASLLGDRDLEERLPAGGVDGGSSS